MRKLPIIAAAILLSACVKSAGEQIDAAQKTWVGAPLDELIVSWGPPDKSAELSNGTRVYEWSETKRIYAPVPTTSYNTVQTAQGPVNFTTNSSAVTAVGEKTCYARFVVNAENVITGYSRSDC